MARDMDRETATREGRMPDVQMTLARRDVAALLLHALQRRADVAHGGRAYQKWDRLVVALDSSLRPERPARPITRHAADAAAEASS